MGEGRVGQVWDGVGRCAYRPLSNATERDTDRNPPQPFTCTRNDPTVYVGAGAVGGVVAVGEGVVGGVKTVGGGLASGVKTVGEGAVGGVAAIGGGLASGAKSVGEGVAAVGSGVAGATGLAAANRERSESEVRTGVPDRDRLPPNRSPALTSTPSYFPDFRAV